LPVWFFLRMVLNAMDGMLAREFNQSSTLGAYLNELGDVISDAALYLPFAFVQESSIALVGVVIFLSCLSEMAGVIRMGEGTARRHDGPMGKSDRAFVFGTIGLLLGMGIPPGEWLGWTLAVVAVLLVVTIANRVKRGASQKRDAGYRQSGKF
jgi:CDP-diacylglycerol--glycerol-3-phosphate 3-phosphatidyltransferase